MSLTPKSDNHWNRLDLRRRTATPRLRVTMRDGQGAGAPPIDEVPIAHVEGDVRVLQGFPSARLAGPRDIWIYLPPGYEGSEARFPVLYMHDGNNLFDPFSAFCHQDWGASETAEWMIQAGLLPPLIIVGVANTPDRLAEYSWAPCPFYGGGKGPDYAHFLVEELKPYIDGAYRTRPEREHTGVMGASLGGLVSLYMGHHAGDAFAKVGAMSPSIWWANRRVLRDLATVRTDLRIWLDVGSTEGRDGEESARLVQDARALKALLESRGYTVGRDLVHWEVGGADHSESAWGSRLSMALLFLYGDRPPAA